MFIIYGIMTETSIAQLFIAGILPGLMLSGMYCTLIFIMCLRNPQLGPPGERFPWKEKIVSLLGIWGMLVLFFLIIGGLLLRCVHAHRGRSNRLLGGFSTRSNQTTAHKSVLYDALIDSARTTCYVMFIIVGAMVFNVFLGTCGFGVALGDWVNNLSVSRWLILVFILVMYIPLVVLWMPYL